jgi:signal transduction histidine kinase
MRWWLGGAFVLIAALTAALVAAVASRQADRAVRANSEDVAVGKAVSAAFVVERALKQGDLDRTASLAAARRDLALFVFDRSGRLLTAPTSHGVVWANIPGGGAARAAALRDRRYVDTAERTGATLVALPLRRTAGARALVAFAPQPAAYGRSLSIFRHEVARAALWALLIAAAVGVLAAALVARRLGRIGSAAAAIAEGDFNVPLRPRFGDEVGSLALSIDRMRARLRASFDELRGERDRLGRLLEQLHEGVLAVDRAGRVQFANAAARELLAGVPLGPGSVVPSTLGEVELGELAAGLFRVDAAIAEARVEAPEGRTLSLVGIPAIASGLALLVFGDISAQERRERAEREFVTNASHELRTPVSAILAAVEALESGAKESPADRDAFVELIGRQANRLARLTRALLVLARAQTHQGLLLLERVDLAPLLDEVAATSEAPGRVVVDCPQGLSVLAQRDLTEQVFANLLENALKHTQGDAVWLTARADGDAAVVEVKDAGSGIPPRVQDRVFDRFYSGENGLREGFGLGLAIARDAVRALGGRIDIESTVGRGTTVRIALAVDGAS